jgi:integral membrane protein (TIGR00529 family)
VIDIVKLLGILALIIWLLRLGWNLGLILVLASAATALLFGLPLQDLILDALQATVDPLTLQLIAIVLLITLLGTILRSTLQLKGMIRSLSGLVRDSRWLLALIPTFIGMLPMVGGAMFSAPMVEEASQGLEVSPERRTFVNYWFRHSLETIFPLYPSLVVAAGLMNVPVQTLTLTQWPLVLAMLAGGILFGLVGIKRAGISTAIQGTGRDTGRDAWILLVKSTWPIALVLFLSIVLRMDLVLALLLTVAILVVVNRLGPRQLLPLIRSMPFDIVPIIVGTMIFRKVLETSGAISVTSEALASLGIPLGIIVFAVPMVAGLLTGLAVAAFAIGFPIVFPLCGPDLVGSGYGMLAYAGGVAGLLLSPVHLCLALTRAYFKATWGGVYRMIIPAALLLALTAGLVVLIKQ